MSLVALLSGSGESGFGYGSTAEDVTAGVDLQGKTMLVTGCNSGLGRETVRVLALRGAKVVAAARTVEKAEAAVSGIRGDFTAVACELSDPTSVRACIDHLAATDVRLDAILCNAGIMALPELHQAHGYELQFFTNHIGHFILVTGLLDQLTEHGRVVITSSSAHTAAPREGIQFDNLSGEKGYSGWKNYGQSKLANLLFVKQLATRLAGTGKTANAVHPGVIKTNLARSMSPVARLGLSLAGPLVLKTIPQGAATQVYVATSPKVAGVSGKYFKDCNVATPSKLALRDDLAERLWEVSERIVAEVSAG